MHSRRERSNQQGKDPARVRGLWQTFATPGVVWLLVFFVVPVYAIVATAASTRVSILGTAVPEWNPVYWQPDSFRFVAENVFSSGGLFQQVFIRTFTYVMSAVALCLLIGYPVAYYMSRLHGRVRNAFLILMVLPFWVSYLMRIFAWVNLLQRDGLVNRVLSATGFLAPQPWLEGRSSTVVFGLVYGYMPFLILPLYAALERIDKDVVNAALDLGASPTRVFFRVTLPLSKQGILAGMAIIMLPMFGDFYTASLLGNPSNTMIGNLVNSYLTTSTSGASQARGAALVIVLAGFVSLLTFYYLISTAKVTKEAQR